MKKLKSTKERIEDVYEYLFYDKNGNLIIGIIFIVIPVVFLYIFGFESYTDDAILLSIEGLINIHYETIGGMFLFGIILIIKRIGQRFVQYLEADSTH